MGINSEVQKLEAGSVIRVFELDGEAAGAGVLRFHGHNRGPIYLNGLLYQPYPIRVEGLEKNTERPARPQLSVANLDGSVSALCNMFDDMVGFKVTVRSTLSKFIDARNFDGPELVLNGDFETDLAGWTVTAGVAVWDAGAALVGDAALSTTIRTAVAIPVEVGKTYVLRFDVTGNIVSSSVGTTSSNSTQLAGANATLGANERTFTAIASTAWLRFSRSANATKARLDNVSLRELGVNADASPVEKFPDEVYYVERKTGEMREQVDFELSSVFDFQDVQLPRRQVISNRCMWVVIGGYRGPYCGYTGGPVATESDAPTTNPALDSCSGSMAGCKLRFGANAELPIGSFPASGLVRT